MRKIILLAVLAIVCLAISASYGAPAVHMPQPFSGPASVLADGTGPYPLCWPNQCTQQASEASSQMVIADGTGPTLADGDISTTILADGTNPYPLCWPNPCSPQVSEAWSQTVIAHGTDPYVLCGANPCMLQSVGSSGQRLADGTNPYPLCFPDPCTPQISNLSVTGLVALQRRGTHRGVSAG
jgi:hypothetical protein